MSLKASVIVVSYNYEKYLRAAIDSALQQTYPNTEVIVVDDGSTDGSAAIIASYGDRIFSILKENGGEASAVNAGFQASHGDVIFILDSDDMLLPKAAENVMGVFSDANVSKVHWPLRIVDEHGCSTGMLLPRGPLPEGDLRQVLIQGGPTSCVSPPTSGNAWARSFLSQVLPVPADLPYYNFCSDEYMFTLAPLFGLVRSINEPQGLYRMHGKNCYASKTFEEKLALEVRGYEEQCRLLKDVLHSQGLTADVAGWQQKSWFLRLSRVIDDVGSVCALNDTLVLVDEDKWGTRTISGRRCLPFLERDGRYWGLPADSQSAIGELIRLRDAGARYIVFTWATFWWLETFVEFHGFLQENARCVLNNERTIIFDLSDQTANVHHQTAAARYLKGSETTHGDSSRVPGVGNLAAPMGQVDDRLVS